MKNTQVEAKQFWFFSLIFLLVSRAGLEKAEFPGDKLWACMEISVTSPCLVALSCGMYGGVCTWMMILPTSL